MKKQVGERYHTRVWSTRRLVTLEQYLKVKSSLAEQRELPYTTYSTINQPVGQSQRRTRQEAGD